MSIVAKFQGGPRAGRKNTLKNHDQAPKSIPVPAGEAKAKNMKPGTYVKSGDQVLDANGAHQPYVWRES